MKHTDIVNALQNPGKKIKGSYGSIKDLLLNNIWNTLLPLTDGVNIANDTLKKQKKNNLKSAAQATLGSAFINSSPIEPSRSFFNLSTTQKLADGKTGFALTAMGNNPTPMIFLCVDNDNKIYATTFIFDNAERSASIPPEDLEFTEVNIDQVENVIFTWAKNYISPEHIELMANRAVRSTIEEAIGWSPTLSHPKELAQTPDLFEQQLSTLLSQASQLITGQRCDDGGIFAAPLTQALQRRNEITAQHTNEPKFGSK
jgi:hypothetical protein